MGYLGLDETPVKDDNIFQRLFWPSDNPSDTDALGVQGFWICIIVAVLSTIALILSGNWLLACIVFAFFALGGIGVREHSVPAAVLMAVAYLGGQIGNLLLGLPPGALGVIATLMLFTNIRATRIASRWARLGDQSAMPERRSETFLDRFVDQMPAKIWPSMRIPFFCIAGIYLIILTLGTAILARRVAHPAPAPEPMQIELPAIH
jgi:hypothetical protein